MPVDVSVPSVGESITEVFVGAWLKQPGDAVKRDDALVELETDKATVEVPSPVDGVLAEQLVAAGDTANVGDVIARVEAAEGAEVAAAPESTAAAETTSEAASEAPTQAPAPAADEGKVMPAAARALATHGLQAGDVTPTGPGGRLLKEDVARVAQSGAARDAEGAKTAPATAGAPSPAAAQVVGDREEEVVPLSPLRRRVAERLVAAQHTAALLTTFNEVDMSAVMALRNEHKDAFEKRHGVRLGFMSFFVRATIEALREFPQINAEIREQSIVYKNYYDIGVAVSTPKGLMVPVLRDAQRLSFAQIEAAIGDFGKRAQANKIAPEELQGGTFTITNGGVFGSLMSTPIVNPPQSGVLGMHAIQQRPIAVKGEVVIRPMMYVALTYDHRIVDGREAVTFLRRIKEGVEQPARMLLEV